MRALLSFDQAPPLAAPLRFFLTAPLFSALAGLLLLLAGPQILVSRWTPGTLALTHLITAGFMLQVMLGALIQILPVVAGANLKHPLLVASLVHGTITPGALLLCAAFLLSDPLAFEVAALLLAAGVGVFLLAAGRALYAVPTTSPTSRGLRLALPGLAISVALGVLLAGARAGSLPPPQATPLHVAWGLIGWGVVLLAAVAFVVVPMFQMTPPYPQSFAGFFPLALLGMLAVWSLAESVSSGALATALSAAPLGGVAVFAALTLELQQRSQRARMDATQHYWRWAMICALAASALVLAAHVVPTIGERREWPLICGTLVLFGGFVAVMTGMLYKIVPFLIWLNLQNLGQGRILAPTMNRVITAKSVNRQTIAHFAALALLLAASAAPEWLARPAGLAVLVASGWLMLNLLRATSFHRQHVRRIQSLVANCAAQSGQ